MDEEDAQFFNSLYDARAKRDGQQRIQEEKALASFRENMAHHKPQEISIKIAMKETSGDANKHLSAPGMCETAVLHHFFCIKCFISASFYYHKKEKGCYSGRTYIYFRNREKCKNRNWYWRNIVSTCIAYIFASHINNIEKAEIDGIDQKKTTRLQKDQSALGKGPLSPLRRRQL